MSKEPRRTITVALKRDRELTLSASDFTLKEIMRLIKWAFKVYKWKVQNESETS